MINISGNLRMTFSTAKAYTFGPTVINIKVILKEEKWKEALIFHFKMELIFVRIVDTQLVLGLAIWISGFAFMVMGWLVGELSEKWGKIPSKILYKIGAVIVAVPVIILLWKVSAVLYVNRFHIATYINNAFQFVNDAFKVL